MVEIPHQFCTVVKKSLRECKRDFLNDFSHPSYLEGHQSICAKKENGLFYSTFQLEFFSNTIPTRLRLNTSQQGKWCKEAALKGKVVVLLTHCSPRRLPRSDEFGPFGSHVEHISQPHLRRTCVATMQELCHELH